MMKWKPIVLGAAAGALAGLALGAVVERPGPVSPPPSKPPVDTSCPPPDTAMALLGDSYAAGLAPSMSKLAAACGTSFHGDGRVGTSATKWQQSEWLAPTLATGPRFVLISLGGNDFQMGNPAALKAAVETIVSKIRAVGATPLWIEPLNLPFEDKVGARDMWKQAVGEGHWLSSEGVDFPRASDKIHLFPDGYERWAKIVWRWASRVAHEQRARERARA